MTTRGGFFKGLSRARSGRAPAFLACALALAYAPSLACVPAAALAQALPTPSAPRAPAPADAGSSYANPEAPASDERAAWLSSFHVGAGPDGVVVLSRGRF